MRRKWIASTKCRVLLSSLYPLITLATIILIIRITPHSFFSAMPPIYTLTSSLNNLEQTPPNSEFVQTTLENDQHKIWVFHVDWYKLEKCPIDISLDVVNLEKQFLGFVVSVIIMKPIIPFGVVWSHLHKNQGSILPIN